LETSVVIQTDRKLRNIRIYGGKLEELQKALNAARPTNIAAVSPTRACAPAEVSSATAAFVYDRSTGRSANGLTVASAEGHAPMVNWDVVSHDWDGMKQELRDVAVDIKKGWKRLTG
jgi:hypothetical protein